MKGDEWYIQNLATYKLFIRSRNLDSSCEDEVSFILHLFWCEVLHVLVLVSDSQTRVSVSCRLSLYVCVQFVMLSIFEQKLEYL